MHKRRWVLAVTTVLLIGVGLVAGAPARAAISCNEYHDGETFTESIVVSGPDCFIKNSVVNGSITVPSGGTVFVGYGKVYGDVLVKSGGEADLEGNRIFGNVTAIGGVIHVGDSGRITGRLVSTDGGASASTSPFGYNFSVLVCNTGIGDIVKVTGATSNVVIGDDQQCGPNRIGNNVTLNNNQSGVSFVNGPQEFCNSSGVGGACGVNGNVTVNGNQGTAHDEAESAEVGFNTINGNLACSGNVNGVTDDASSITSNVVSGFTTGQCAGL